MRKVGSTLLIRDFHLFIVRGWLRVGQQLDNLIRVQLTCTTDDWALHPEHRLVRAWSQVAQRLHCRQPACLPFAQSRRRHDLFDLESVFRGNGLSLEWGLRDHFLHCAPAIEVWQSHARGVQCLRATSRWLLLCLYMGWENPIRRRRKRCSVSLLARVAFVSSLHLLSVLWL